MVLKMRDMMKRRDNQKGFTLVELIVVMAILAILAGIAVPKFTGASEKAREAAHKANIRTIDGAASMWLAENGNPAADIADATTDLEGAYLKEMPESPWTGGDPYTVSISSTGVIVVDGGEAP